jgi:VWFA-related protein
MIARTGMHTRLSVAARCGTLLACVVVFSVPPARAQSFPGSPTGRAQRSPSGAAPAQAPPVSAKPDTDTHNSVTPIESRAYLVPVRVVVRDPKGQVVPNLRKEDFQVFEDGKLQDVSHFFVETPAVSAQTFVRTDSPAGAPGSANPPPDFIPPSRFIALLFDDVHVAMPELVRARIVATQYVDESLQPTDRVAVFTISGQSQMEFTSDRDKLHAALLDLSPRATVGGGVTGTGDGCPPIDYYEADLIENKGDPQAFNVATHDTLACFFKNDPLMLAAARQMAKSTAMHVNEEGGSQTEYSFRRLEEIIRRISSLPGQRSLVLISPGFIDPGREYHFSQIIDQANRSSVFINTLDARGLYTPDMGDISKPFQGDPAVAGTRSLYRSGAQTAQSEVLIGLADGTGGVAFHDNNDLTGGLRMIAAPPEVSYLLAFVPHDFKYDGKFHSLKVTLVTKERVTIQARHGFYAPKQGVSEAESAKKDIEETLYSQEEHHDLPIELHIQFHKVDSANSKLAVMTFVDIAHMRFEKEAGRNKVNLTIVAALFDRDGNIVKGIQKNVDMNLLDATLQKLSSTGLTVKTDFDVKPGDYVVRLVVRDSNAAKLSAENGVVEIPQ